jgi:hypothetical protein
MQIELQRQIVIICVFFVWLFALILVSISSEGILFALKGYFSCMEDGGGDAPAPGDNSGFPWRAVQSQMSKEEGIFI